LNVRQVAKVDLDQLIDLFYQPENRAEQLGVFQLCAAADMPGKAQRLLAHNHHMTVTMEAEIGAPVDLRVLASVVAEQSYSRKILLLDGRNGQPVMFGLVRIALASLDLPMRQAIVSGTIPLGRVLIESDLLRQVNLLHLYRIEPGSELQEAFSIAGESDRPPAGSGIRQPEFYARTALIFLNSQPVVELLEIVTVEH
jgi:chorismate-pyruvate lyase